MADNFDTEILALSAALPVALLPVRLEARFFDNARELRLRIYPDQVHVDAHEPRPFGWRKVIDVRRSGVV